MNWAIYGWALLVVSILKVARYRVKPDTTTPETRFARALFDVMFFLPLVGHLVGWW